jgi:hypothetical protein
MKNCNGLLQLIPIIILGIISFKACQKEKQYSQDLEKLLELTQHQKIMLLDADKGIYAANVAVTQANEKLTKIIDTLEYIKKPTIITKIRTVTKIDTVYIPFTNPETRNIQDIVYLKTPQPFFKIDKWYSIRGTINKDGIFFDSLSYRNDFYVATGTQDHGSFIKNVFKANRTIVTVKDNNPYTVTKTLQQTVVNTPKNRWHLGPNASLFYDGEKFVPTVGLGVTYSIFSF